MSEEIASPAFADATVIPEPEGQPAEPSKPVESQPQTQEPLSNNTQHTEQSYEPDWLYEMRDVARGNSQYQQPQQTQQTQQQQYYQPPQQQYQQQRQPVGDLDALLENPRDYIARVMQEGMSQYGAQNQMTQQQLWMIQRANVSTVMNDAERAVQRGYQEVLNRDDSFRGNERVRELVEGTLKQMMSQAEQAAWYGNPGAARAFDNPRFFPALVAAAKIAAGAGDMAQMPAQPAGATAGRVTQRVEDSSVELPPDLEEVARVLGPAKRAQLEKEYARSLEIGDFVL